jgi:hypothetical protein
VILPKYSIDDFKTERKDISPPLPAILKLVPIFLYLSLVALVVLASLFFAQLRIATGNIETHRAGMEAAKAQIAQLGTQRTQLEAQILKATDIQRWVEGSQPLQPLLVAITRSIEQNAALADLKMERDAENPSSLKIGMRIATTLPRQLEKTTDAISSQNFRVVQPEQTLAEGEINYRATIVPSLHQSSAAATPPTTTP